MLTGCDRGRGQSLAHSSSACRRFPLTAATIDGLTHYTADLTLPLVLAHLHRSEFPMAPHLCSLLRFTGTMGHWGQPRVPLPCPPDNDDGSLAFVLLQGAGRTVEIALVVWLIDSNALIPRLARVFLPYHNQKQSIGRNRTVILLSHLF